MDVFVLAANKVCNGTSCLAHGLRGAFSITVQKSFAVKSGQKFNIVVDAPNGNDNAYTISMACAWPK